MLNKQLNSKPQSVRAAYGETLVELGKENKKIVVLDADVSSSTQSRLFGQKYPERFFNVGIAEGNMMAMAAGMATCGKIPFVNTFAVFITLRAGDPLRSLIAYPGLNVKLGAGYAGVSDSYDGASHQSVEDIAIVRSIPNITVIVAADAVEARAATIAATEIKGPVYLRLSRAEVPVIYDDNYRFTIGKAHVLQPGSDLTIAATGYMIYKALLAADVLKQKGVSVRVLAVPTIKPLDEEAVLAAARETGAILTMEEHSIYGGLGSAVTETVSQKYPVPIKIMGFADRFGETGGYDEVLDKMGLSVAKICFNAENLLTMKKQG
jgi:transketolase